MTTMDDIVGRLRELPDQARSFAARHGLGWRHGAATGAVVVAGLAVMGLARAATGQDHEPIDSSQRLKIEVVQPVEPVFTSGPVMEVGTLVDGFDPGMLRSVAVAGPDPMIADPFAPDEPKGGGGFFRRFTSAIQQAMPREERPSPQQIRREDRSYGFDAPRPDWQAEREARRAWRDRIEAERRAERRDREQAMRDRYEAEREHYERERYEAARSGRDMRQPMPPPAPYNPYAGEPVG